MIKEFFISKETPIIEDNTDEDKPIIPNQKETTQKPLQETKRRNKSIYLKRNKEEPKNEPKEKIGKERLSFFNADKTKIKRVIDTYKHFRTKFEGITIHNNGNSSASAKNDVNWALNELPKVSWHYSVDDKEVVRFLAHPDFWNYSCWCSGDGQSLKCKTINIEICEFNGKNLMIRDKFKIKRKCYTSQLLNY